MDNNNTSLVTMEWVVNVLKDSLSQTDYVIQGLVVKCAGKIGN